MRSDFFPEVPVEELDSDTPEEFRKQLRDEVKCAVKGKVGSGSN